MYSDIRKLNESTRACCWRWGDAKVFISALAANHVTPVAIYDDDRDQPTSTRYLDPTSHMQCKNFALVSAIQELV